MEKPYCCFHKNCSSCLPQPDSARIFIEFPTTGRCADPLFSTERRTLSVVSMKTLTSLNGSAITSRGIHDVDSSTFYMGCQCWLRQWNFFDSGSLWKCYYAVQFNSVFHPILWIFYEYKHHWTKSNDSPRSKDQNVHFPLLHTNL